jgi:hypothetical protein
MKKDTNKKTLEFMGMFWQIELKRTFFILACPYRVGLYVPAFFIFNCHGFKPVAIENKKSSTAIPHAS